MGLTSTSDHNYFMTIKFVGFCIEALVYWMQTISDVFLCGWQDLCYYAIENLPVAVELMVGIRGAWWTRGLWL